MLCWLVTSNSNVCCNCTLLETLFEKFQGCYFEHFWQVLQWNVRESEKIRIFSSTCWCTFRVFWSSKRTFWSKFRTSWQHFWRLGVKSPFGHLNEVPSPTSVAPSIPPLRPDSRTPEPHPWSALALECQKEDACPTRCASSVRAPTIDSAPRAERKWFLAKWKFEVKWFC